MLGLNHHTAPLALRERLSFSHAEVVETLERCAREGLLPGATSELAILSTCGRTELLAVLEPGSSAPETGFEALAQLLAAERGVAPDEFLPHCYRYVNDGAFAHLCRVAAGLDSMVLGEAEILGQLHAAQGHSEHAGTAGEQLQGIFARAIRVGRRARSETGICRNAASVSSEAVRLAADSMGPLSGCRVLVVGTGRMARLAGESLRRLGVTDLTVASRTCEHAGALATEWGARTIVWDDLVPALSEVDLVVSATGAPHAVLSTEVVAAALVARASQRPLLFLDIALPRDVEPEVRQLPGVEVFDLEDLQTRLRDNLDARSRDIPSVERIIAEEVGRFRSWRRSCALRPVLGAMHRRGEEIRRREVERMLRRIPDATPELREQIEALTLALVRKLLHEPSRRLRDETDPLRSSAYVAATRDLFALRESEHRSAGAGEQ